MLLRRTLPLAFVALVALGAFCSGVRPARAAGEVKVVASFSILADLVRQVGGDRVSVRSLVPAGGDVHVYQPSPADSKAVAEADLVVLNGLALEGWGDRLVKASGYRGVLVRAADGIVPRSAMGQEAQAHPSAADPHAWQDVANVRIYVANIAAALERVDPAGRPAYEARAAAYLKELDELDADIRRTYAAIPVAARRVITSHDAFGYYGAAYGITFLAPLGTSTDTEASARDIARLIGQIRAEKVKAIFIESISDPRMIRRIAAEAHVRVGGALFSDSLSPPGGPADTYIEMMRHNQRLLAAAMRGEA